MQTHFASPTAFHGFRLFFDWNPRYVAQIAARQSNGPVSRFRLQSLNAPSSATPSPTNADHALVQAMACEDEQAAAALYDRYGAIMYGLALRMVTEPADAEEVVLDAFAQAWKDAVRFDGERGTVIGWLTTITRSRALDAIRARGRRSRTVDSAFRQLDEPAAMGEAAPPTDQAAEQVERAIAVGSAMQTLPMPQRLAIEMAFYEGMTHQEVAERLQEPLGTVKTRIRLGMLKLRDMLTAFAPEHSL